MPLVNSGGILLPYQSSYGQTSSTSLYDLANTGQLTVRIKASFLPTQTAPYPRLVEFGGSGGKGWSLQVGKTFPSSASMYFGSTTGWSGNVATGPILQPNTVYDIIVPMTLSQMSLYVNGVLQGSGPAPTYYPVSARALTIGEPGGAGMSESMVVQLVQIYNRAVTAQEIASGNISRTGLIGEWIPNQGQGNTTPDTSGSGMTMTWTGARWAQLATSGTQGLIVNGFTDYVTVPNSAVLSPLATTGQMTVEARIVPFSTSGNRNWFLCKGNSGQYEYGLYVNNNSLQFVLWQLSGTNIASVGYTVPNGVVNVPLDVVVTVDLNAQQLTMYVNGVSVASSTSFTGSYSAGTSALSFGKRLDNNGFFNGVIQCCRIYNRVLSAQEVLNNYSGQVARNGLVGEWLFQEGQGVMTADTSGNGNTGTLSGCRWAAPTRTTGLFLNGITDYVDMGTNLPTISNAITLEAEVLLTTYQPGGSTLRTAIMSRRNVGVGCAMTIANSDPPATAGQIELMEAGTMLAHSTGIVPLGKVTRIAITVSNGVATFYINGVKDSSVNVGTWTFQNGNDFTMGSQFANPTTRIYYLNNGYLRLGRVYSRALSAQEIANNYAGNVVRDSSLVGEWIFNQGQGTIVPDTSGNGFNGTLGGGRWATLTAPANGANLLTNPQLVDSNGDKLADGWSATHATNLSCSNGVQTFQATQQYGQMVQTVSGLNGIANLTATCLIKGSGGSVPVLQMVPYNVQGTQLPFITIAVPADGNFHQVTVSIPQCVSKVTFEVQDNGTSNWQPISFTQPVLSITPKVPLR